MKDYEAEMEAYWTQSIWVGAYLYERGCKLIRAELLPTMRMRWIFEAHPARELARLYRDTPDEAIANAPALADAWHLLQRTADAVREFA